jgi:hypothetical protein
MSARGTSRLIATHEAVSAWVRNGLIAEIADDGNGAKRTFCFHVDGENMSGWRRRGRLADLARRVFESVGRLDNAPGDLFVSRRYAEH